MLAPSLYVKSKLYFSVHLVLHHSDYHNKYHQEGCFWTAGGYSSQFGAGCLRRRCHRVHVWYKPPSVPHSGESAGLSQSLVQTASVIRVLPHDVILIISLIHTAHMVPLGVRRVRRAGGHSQPDPVSLSISCLWLFHDGKCTQAFVKALLLSDIVNVLALCLLLWVCGPGKGPRVLSCVCRTSALTWATPPGLL